MNYFAYMNICVAGLSLGVAIGCAARRDWTGAVACWLAAAFNVGAFAFHVWGKS